MSYSVRILKDPSESELEQAVNICSKALGPDDSTKCMTEYHPERVPTLLRAMLRAGISDGNVFVTTDPNDPSAIRSVAISFGPGKKFLDSEKQATLGWTDFWETISEKGKSWWGIFITEHEKMEKDVLGEQGGLNEWWIDVMATDPAYQRRGYGTAIMKAICQKAIADSKIVGLATQAPENVEWYGSLGFKVRKSCVITMEPFEEGKSFPSHMMTRDPTKWAKEE